MSKETAVLLLGILVVILPFTGFPGTWRVLFLVLSGAGLAALGLVLRAEAFARTGHTHRAGSAPFRGKRHRQSRSFAESAEGHMPENEREEERTA